VAIANGGTRPIPLPPPRAPAVAARPFLSLAFGGGGTFGIGYLLGVAAALTEAGVPLRDAPMLGTSAGSWAAACLATDARIDRLREIPQVRIPDAHRGTLRAVAAALFGEATSPQVTACAVRLPFGRRELLSGADYALADIVAASSSVPVLFAPHRIGTARYVDGGVRSLVSAQLAAEADHLLVVAPIAGPMFGPAGRGMEAMLRRELRRWTARTGGRAHLIRPNAAVVSLARTPLQLFDHHRAVAAYFHGYEQAERLVAVRPGLAALRRRGHAPEPGRARG
jgi:predicted acylesterase/phospholipase RssA